MLAVRLHKKKRPNLNKGCYLIPIISWRVGRHQILNWVRTLNTQNENNPNNAIRYITLVKIPDNHPIALFADWGIRKAKQKSQQVEFKTLEECEEDLKAIIDKWHPYDYGLVQQTTGVLGAIPPYGGPCEAPEFILGKALPKSFIKWTKDINLLYKGDKKRK